MSLRGAKKPLVLAVPSKGRLQENAAAFFARAGLESRKRGARDYRGTLAGLENVEIAFLSAADIVAQLASGHVHLGVTGEDLVRETIADAEAKVELLAPLGFGHAHVVVAVPRAWIDVKTMADLEDVAAAFRARRGERMRVATKYVHLTRRFFAERHVADYRIVESLGATEGAPAAGKAELIVDITTTGATLAANALKILDDGTILRSQANLVASVGADWSPGPRETARIILSRIAAEEEARTTREVSAVVSTLEDASARGSEGSVFRPRALPCSRWTPDLELPERQGRAARRLADRARRDPCLRRGARLCVLGGKPALREAHRKAAALRVGHHAASRRKATSIPTTAVHRPGAPRFGWFAVEISSTGFAKLPEIFEADDLDLRGARCRRVEEFFLLKSPKDLEVKVALNADAGFHVADEDTQFEVERAGGHSGKQDLRGRYGQDELICLGDRNQRPRELCPDRRTPRPSRGITIRPVRSLRTRLVTTPVTRLEFGMMTWARSKVSISVARTLMRRTKP